VIEPVTGAFRYRIAPDFEWNDTTNRAQIRISLAGTVIAVHDTAYDPEHPPGGGCSGTLGAAPAGDPAGLVGLLEPGVAALLAFAALQALRRRRAAQEFGLEVAAQAAIPSPRWRAGLAVVTGGVFLIVITIPVPLFGPGRGTAIAVSPPSVTYFHADHLGSSVVVTNAAGALLRHVIYRPFGGVVAESAGGPTEPPEVGFTGQRFEAEAGLYDYGARWYFPRLGRFLQPDWLVPEPFNPQSLNRYSYAMNDPVNRTDPSGNLSFHFTGASTYSGTIYGSNYGADIYIGSGTRYHVNVDAPLTQVVRAGGIDQPSQPQIVPGPPVVTAEGFAVTSAVPSHIQPFDPRPSSDLGPGSGLIPNAFNEAGTWGQPSVNSAVVVAMPLATPQAARTIAAESGQLALALVRNNRAVKLALDRAGLFRPGLNNIGKIQPKGWSTGRFLSRNAWASGPVEQFGYGFAAAQLDPGQTAPESPNPAFRAGYIAGTIFSYAKTIAPW
jgi:RHS repeat-associated protein